MSLSILEALSSFMSLDIESQLSNPKNKNSKRKVFNNCFQAYIIGNDWKRKYSEKILEFQN